MAGQSEDVSKNVFSKGLNKDQDANTIPPDMYPDMLNAVELSVGGNILQRTNERGTRELSSRVLSALTPSARFQVIGHFVLNGEVILLSVSEDGVWSEIGVLDRNENYTSLVTSDELNFSIEHECDVEARTFINGDRIVYWTDDYNSPRVLNLDNIPTSNLAASVDLFVTQKLPVTTFSRIREKEGTLTAGTYQFVCRYLNDNLDPAFFGIITNPIPVNIEFRSQGRHLYDGDVQGRATTKAIELVVNNIDTNFKFIELIAIVKDGPVGIPSSFIAQRKEISDTSMTFVFSSLTDRIGDVTLDTIIAQRPAYTTAKCIKQIDGHLILSNLKAVSTADLQKLANRLSLRYRVNEIEYQEPTNIAFLSGSPPSGDFAVKSVYYKPLVVDDGTIKNLNIMVFEFTDDVDPASVNISSVGLIQIAVTGGVFVNTRITPTKVTVSGKFIYADFGTTINFDDAATWNFTEADIIESTNPNFVALTTWGVGSDLDAISGGPTNDVSSTSAVTYTGTGLLYQSERTCSITETAGVVVVDLLTDFTERENTLVAFGTNHNSTTEGIFNVIAVDGVDPTLLTIDSTATGNDPVGTPVLTRTSSDITRQELVQISATNALPNDGYFGDYIDEKMATDYRTYMREEVYSKSVQFVFANGGLSEPFHIPGKSRAFAQDAIPDVPVWDAIAYTSGSRVSYLGNIYVATSAAIATDIPDQTPLVWNYVPGFVQSGWIGTYESIDQYPTSTAYPQDTASPTGPDYSKNNLIRHHKMPSNDQEPIYKVTPDGKIYIRPIGIMPVWDDNGTIKTVKDLVTSFGLQKEIVGVIFGREKRDDTSKRSIAMQGIAQNLWQHQGNFLQPYPETDTEPYLSNGYLFGKTVIHPGARVYPRHDADYRDVGYGATEQRKDLVCFYSPDIDLLDRLPQVGVSVKPVLTIYGKIETIIQSLPDIRRQSPRGGLLHLFCSYNNIRKANGISPVLPSVVQVERTTYTDGTYSFNGTRFSGINPRVNNYYNEGYILLNLGIGNVLPEPEPGQREIIYNMAVNDGGFAQGTNSGDSFIEDFSVASDTNYFSTRCLYNLMINNPSQYGSVGSAVYTNAGVFPILSSMNNVEDYLYFGGDIFISKFSYKNSNNFLWAVNTKQGPDQQNGSRNKFPYVESPRNLGDQTGQGEELRALGYFFVESEANCNWRHRQVEQDTATGNFRDIGAAYYPNLPLVSGAVFNRVEYPPGSGNYYTQFVFSTNPDDFGVLDFEPFLGQATGYNKSYSAQDEIGIQVSSPFGAIEITDYSDRSIYSLKSIEGEAADKYRSFPVNNYHDIPKFSGEIINTFIQGNVLYLQTLNSIWRTFINERTMMPSSSGDVVLGNGGLFPIPSKELMSVEGGNAGIQNQFGGIETIFGYTWIDRDRGKLFRLTGEESVEELSVSGMISWLAENLKPSPATPPPGYVGSWNAVATYVTGNVVFYNSIYYKVIQAAPAGIVPVSFTGKSYYEALPESTELDNPSNPNAQGIRLGFDSKYKRLLITKRDGEKSFTLTYSLLTNSFISYHSYIPTRYISVNNKTLGIDNKNNDNLGLKIYSHNEGDYGKFYSDTIKPFVIAVVVNKSPEMGKVLDNLILLTRSENIDGVEVLNDTFKKIECWTKNGYTGEIVLDPAYPSVGGPLTATKVVRKNGEFRLAIPPDMVLDKDQNIFDSSNLALSLPTNDARRRFRPRMKEKYFIVKLTYSNQDNNKIVVNSVLSLFRYNTI